MRSPLPPHPMELTILGRRLRRQADRHFGPHPAAPPRLPEPLATAAITAGGRRRVRYLGIIARSTKLKEAAVQIGMYTGNLRASLRALEAMYGDALLEGGRSNRPHRITRLGRRLLRQARHHPNIVKMDQVPGRGPTHKRRDREGDFGS